MDRTALVFAGLLLAAPAAWSSADVNTATREQLEAEGIGPVGAQAVIDYRAKHGPFKSTDEIRRVISEAIAGRLSLGISISGPPAAKPPSAPPKAAPKEEAKPKVDKGGESVRKQKEQDQEDRKT